jgi:hypothetical protein
LLFLDQLVPSLLDVEYQIERLRQFRTTRGITAAQQIPHGATRHPFFIVEHPLALHEASGDLGEFRTLLIRQLHDLGECFADPLLGARSSSGLSPARTALRLNSQRSKNRREHQRSAQSSNLH